MVTQQSANTVRFHVPSMHSEDDVGSIAKAIREVDVGALVVFDRGTREFEIRPGGSSEDELRRAITEAGFCITR